MGTVRGSRLRLGSVERSGTTPVTLAAADVGVVQRYTTALSIDHTLNLPAAGSDGREVPVNRQGRGPGKLTIVGGSTTEIIPPYTPAAVIFRDNGTTWEKFWYNTHDDAFTFGRQGAASLFGAWGDGDPGDLVDLFLSTPATAAPTNTAQTTTIARAVKFRLPQDVTVTAVRMWSTAALAAASGWMFAIYPVAAGSARSWGSAATATLANAWMSVAVASVLLAANTDYWFCMAPVATGTTAPFRTPPPHPAAAFFGADAAPLGGKLNLGIPVQVQFAITAGTWPANLPAVAAPAWTSGSVVPAWLEGTAA